MSCACETLVAHDPEYNNFLVAKPMATMFAAATKPALEKMADSVSGASPEPSPRKSARSNPPAPSAHSKSPVRSSWMRSTRDRSALGAHPSWQGAWAAARDPPAGPPACRRCHTVVTARDAHHARVQCLDPRGATQPRCPHAVSNTSELPPLSASTSSPSSRRRCSSRST